MKPYNCQCQEDWILCLVQIYQVMVPMWQELRQGMEEPATEDFEE